MKTLKIATAVAIALAASAATAGVDDMFNLRGYGTLGVAHSTLDDADLVRDVFLQSQGAGHTDSWSLDVDSRAAVQLDATFTPRLTAVVQLVSEAAQNNSWDGDPNKRYKPSLEWANIKYQVSDQFSVRGGRIVVPFLHSNGYRKVGFANHWLRSPVEVYGTIPFSSADGLDMTYAATHGKFSSTVNAFAGVQSVRTEGSRAQSELWGLSYTLASGDFTIRPAYLSVSWTDRPFPELVAVFDEFAAAARDAGANAAVAQAELLSRAYGGKATHYDVYGLSTSYDPGRWFTTAEVYYARAEVDRNSVAGYVTGGVRIGSVTPYATFAKNLVGSNDARIPVSELSGELAEAAGGLNDMLDTMYADSTQHTLSVGVRWDATSSIAVKAELDHVSMREGSMGLVVNRQAEFEAGSDFNVIGLSVDFVF